MRYAASISVLALAGAAFAQDQTVSSARSSIYTFSLFAHAPNQVHVGTDGNGKTFLGFTPQSFNATQGSVITFVFDAVGTNHTVVQSAFASPCEPLANGFSSGFTSGPAGTGDAPATWNLTITDTSKRGSRIHMSHLF